MYFQVGFNWRGKKPGCRIDAALAEVISEPGQHFLIKRLDLERVWHVSHHGAGTHTPNVAPNNNVKSWCCYQLTPRLAKISNWSILSEIKRKISWL